LAGRSKKPRSVRGTGNTPTNVLAEKIYDIILYNVNKPIFTQFVRAEEQELGTV